MSLMRFLKRIGNIVEGLVFLVLSLCFQAIFIVLLTMAVLVGLSAIGLHIESKFWEWVIAGVLLISINALACWEYFRQKTANIGFGTASIIFMFPRAIDLIWNGKESISR